MARERQTWQPTEDGQFVLFGVLGPAHAPDKYKRGYLVMDPDKRELFVSIYDKHAKTKPTVRDDRTWHTRYFPEEERGTWAAEGEEIVLTFKEKEVWRNRVINNAVPEKTRQRDFSPAGMVAAPA